MASGCGSVVQEQRRLDAGRGSFVRMTRMGSQMVNQTGKVLVNTAVKIGVSIEVVLRVTVMMLRM